MKWQVVEVNRLQTKMLWGDIEEGGGDMAMVQWEVVRQLCMELQGVGVEVHGGGGCVRGLKRAAVQAIGQLWGGLMKMDGGKHVKGQREEEVVSMKQT